MKLVTWLSLAGMTISVPGVIWNWRRAIRDHERRSKEYFEKRTHTSAG